MALVEDLVDQVRTLSLQLRPTVLDELGLAATVEWYCQRQVPRLGLVAHYTCAPALPRPHPVIETACFRAAQEAVTNVARHARTNVVWIELRTEDDMLHLAVRDQGVGFDVEAALRRAGRDTGIGLHGMVERLRLVGGRCEIRSTPGRGTAIDARAPLTLATTNDDTKTEEVADAADPGPAGR
jgi:signal transduction histidine kinase